MISLFDMYLRYHTYNPRIKLRLPNNAILGKCIELTKMKFLNLHHNNIDDEQFKGLSDVLETTNIRYLDVSENSITLNGLLQLIYCLHRTKLEKVNLEGNPIGEVLKIDLKTQRKEDCFLILSKLHICLESINVTKIDLSNNELGKFQCIEKSFLLLL